MFDFFLITSFESRPIEDRRFSFLDNDFYDDIRAKEYSFKINNAYVTYLEREEDTSNYTAAGELHFFTYGSVFTNNEYKRLFNIKPKRIYSKEISEFHKAYGNEFLKYIKGSFVIIIYDEKNRETQLMTDRMNVLPLYCYFENSILIVSSSIRMILETGIPGKALNQAALAEQLVFDYVLGNKTFFKHICAASPASIIKFFAGGIRKENYWDIRSLYHETLLPPEESLELLSEQLFENVQLYASDAEKLLVAFTGGFDGRTNVGMLKRPKNDFLCFSFGMPQSRQITIPQSISKCENIHYRPIPLAEEFESVYEKFSSETAEFSNGTAPIIRANYPYAFHKLRDYSTTVITGLFGSEILRPIHNLGIMMNDHSEQLFLSGDPIEMSLRQSFEELKSKKYIKDKILDESFDSIISEINGRFIKKYSDFDDITRMFFFLLGEGVRKYFMQEIQLERVYITNRFPYFDDDLLDLIYRTPFAGMYNGFLGNSKVKRRKGQLLYAYILNKYYPQLGKYVIDRGYSPADLLRITPLNYLFLILGVIKSKINNRMRGIKGSDDFNSAVWTRPTIENTLNRFLLPRDSSISSLKSETNVVENLVNLYPGGIFDNGMISAYQNGSYKDDLLKYTHMISLVKYLNSI